MTAIELIDVSKTYEMQGSKIMALNNVSLKIEEGEAVAVVGTSGSGKSTLLHLLGGIDNASSGEIYVNNIDITTLKGDSLARYRRDEVGLIYQFFNLVSVLNVEENITLQTEFSGEKVDKSKLDELINLLCLNDRRKHFPNQLSGGQQQRVAIARAIFGNPSIILADEPTGNLDSTNSKEVMEALLRLNKQFHKTLVLVTHDLEIATMMDRIIMISDGKIIKDEKN